MKTTSNCPNVSILMQLHVVLDLHRTIELKFLTASPRLAKLSPTLLFQATGRAGLAASVQPQTSPAHHRSRLRMRTI